MSELCRSCLSNTSQIVSLSDCLNNDVKTTISECFIYCTNLEIVENSFICLICVENLKIAFQFKKQCIESDLKLKENSVKNAKEENIFEDIFLDEFGSEDEFFLEDSLSADEIEDSTFTCDKCDNIFYTKRALNVHGCTVSSIKFDSPKLYVPSIKVKSRAKLKKGISLNFLCSLCGRSFSSNYRLKVHHSLVHLNEKKHICNICNSKFATKNTLAQHKSKHSDERPYKCEICPSEYKLQNSLKIHLRVHRGERPYSCTICNAAFTQKSSLTRHAITHTGEQPYSCEICQTKFTLKDGLRVHMKLHKENTIECPDCDKTFNTKIKLKVHSFQHTGLKPFGCDRCPISFTAKSRLKKHISTIHSGIKFQCEFCKQEFNRKDNLRTHVLKNHGQVKNQNTFEEKTRKSLVEEKPSQKNS